MGTPENVAIAHEEIRDLIAKGWTPPAPVMDRYRHLLRPFYDARGWKSLPGRLLDNDDCATIAALIATFDHFGIEVPEPKPQPVIVPVGTTVLP